MTVVGNEASSIDSCVHVHHPLVSAVSAAADKASSSEERSRTVGRESWRRSVKASAVNSHHYKRQVVTFY